MFPINRKLPRLSTLCLLATVCLSSWLAFGRPNPEPQPAHAAVAPRPSALAPQPISRVKPISEVQLGERTIGQNPLREQVDDDLEQPSEATWRKLTLRMPKDKGKWLTVELLRSLGWIEAEEAAVGETIFLDLAEMGAIGDAEVVSIDPCPPIQPGKGNVITGRFIHEVEQGEVVEIRFANQPEATRVTKNHPYWSIDRDDFIPAGELREGETVDGLNGTITVASITPSDYAGLVYNLEIHGEHVYRVGSSGLLAHNACARQLRNNMRRAGVHGDPGSIPHHIVPRGSYRGNLDVAASQQILRSHGIGLNTHWNGVNLPSSQRASQARGAIHESVHTNAYFQTVREALEAGEAANGRAGVLRALQQLREGLLLDLF